MRIYVGLLISLAWGDSASSPCHRPCRGGVLGNLCVWAIGGCRVSRISTGGGILGRKYSQQVFSEMQRFRNSSGNWCIDKNDKCYLVRNKTKIHFGRAQNLICTVIMTNPGSYGLDMVRGWDDFQYGKGDSHLLQGIGFPDPTMRNIIWAIQSAYDLAQKELPTGYLDVFNLSSVVCPKGENASNYHEYVSQVLSANNISEDILVGTNISTEDGIRSVFEKSPFIITGFLRDTFKDKVHNLLSTSNKYN